MGEAITIPPPPMDLPDPYLAQLSLLQYSALASFYSTEGYTTGHDDLMSAVDFDSRSTALAIASIVEEYGFVNPYVPNQKQIKDNGFCAYFDTYGLAGIDYRRIGAHSSSLIIPRLDITQAMATRRRPDGLSLYFANAYDYRNLSSFLRVSSWLVNRFVETIN